MAILQHEKPWDERRRLIEDAKELRRRHSIPPLEEVLAEMERIGESLLVGLKLPSSTDLLREARGGWPEAAPVPGQDGGDRGIPPTGNSMLTKAKGDFSTLTPDGRAIVDTDRLIRSPQVRNALAVLERKIQTPRVSQTEQASKK